MILKDILNCNDSMILISRDCKLSFSLFPYYFKYSMDSIFGDNICLATIMLN